MPQCHRVIQEPPCTPWRSYRRLEVLVEAEEVGWIVPGLERHQPGVVLAVGALGPLLTLVAQVVHIHRARQVRLPRREQLAGPADVALRISRVGPDRQSDKVVLQVAMVIGRLRLAYPAVRTVELGEDD